MAVAWRPDGTELACVYGDGILEHRAVDGGQVLRRLQAHIAATTAVAWSPDGTLLATASEDRFVRLWGGDDRKAGTPLEGHRGAVRALAWSPDGRRLASASDDDCIVVWDPTTARLLLTLEGHEGSLRGLAWSPDGATVFSSGLDGTVRSWDLGSPRRSQVLVSGTPHVRTLGISSCGTLLAGAAADGSVRVWQWASRESSVVLPGTMDAVGPVSLAFHPQVPALAVAGGGEAIRIWDVEALRSADAAEPVASYAVAKVVVAGEPGVDTSSLLCALAGLPDEAGEATPTWPAIPVARSIVQLPDGCLQRRELYAWGLDLREPDGLLAPIWLADAAGAVVLVDPARLDDHAPPLAGRADVLGPAIGAACPGLLVSVGEGAHAPDADRMEALREEHGFSSCLILDGDREEDLRRLSDAMWELVPWQSLPNASAPWCWPELRAFLLARARGAEALVPWTTLRRELQDHHAPAEVSVEDLRAALAAARLEGLAWPLPFGGLVLLRPELLQRHGAALLRQVLNQAEGLGAVPEASVLQGQQDVTPGGPLGGRDEERLLLHAVVELLVARGIALRQEGWLVFPALVGAGRPHRPVPPRTELEYELTGSREHAFAGLVVRLATSGAFRLRALWRDAADFEGGLGGVCGVVLRRCDGPDVAVGVRFDETVSAETKVLFDGMVGAHLRHWAPTGSLRRERIRFCPGCGRRVTREAVRAAEQAGRASVACLSCDTVLPLRDSLGEHLEPSTAPGGYGVHVLHDPADAREVGRLARALRRRRILAHLNWELLPPGRWFAAATAGALPALRAVAVVLGPEESDRWEAHEVRALVDETVRCSLPVVPVLLPGVKAIPRSLAFLEHFALVSLGPKGGDGRAFDELAQAIRGTTSVSATGETPRPRAQTAARAQQEKLDLWRDLTARSAHRIGNQLFAARGELRLLEAGLSEERRSGTGRVAACLDRIRGIVEEYRRYRRDTPLNRSPTSIGDLVATVADQFRAQAGARTLTTDLSDDLPVCLLDPVLLGDALGELLDNALHHVGDDGQVSVSAALEGEGDAAELRIVVTDNGPGVPAGSKERILEPFVGERPAGSGLGLAIVQSVVERHGGRIAEVGTYGEGAVFEIRIPVEPMTGELR